MSGLRSRSARDHVDTRAAGTGSAETAVGRGHRRELETLISRVGLSNFGALATAEIKSFWVESTPLNPWIPAAVQRVRHERHSAVLGLIIRLSLAVKPPLPQPANGGGEEDRSKKTRHKEHEPCTVVLKI